MEDENKGYEDNSNVYMKTGEKITLRELFNTSAGLNLIVGKSA